MWRKSFAMRSQAPPKIYMTQELEQSLKNWGADSRVRRGFEKIRAAIASGETLGTPPLSKHFRQLQRNPDFLLQYWGIHHLYLDKKINNQVLFTHVDLGAQKVTFLDIREKPSKVAGWFDRSLIKLLVENCSEGDWLEIKGIDGLDVDFTDCEIYHLQNAGLIPLFAIGDRFIMSHPLSLRGRTILARMAYEAELQDR